jgi:hypothetical protein
MSTFAEFTSAVTTRTGSDDSTSIGRYVNEAYVDVLTRTRCKVSSATLSLTAGTSDYSLDTATILEITEIAKVTSVGVDYIPQRCTPQEILALRANSTGSSPVTRYATDGTTLMVWPTPAAADTLTYYYIPRPATLTGSDIPSYLPAQWHKALFWYAAAEASDDRDDESSGQGELYRVKYEKMLRDIRKNMNRMGGRRLPRATVGAGVSAPHDNSADW